MKVTRFYTGADDRTYFEDIEIPVDGRGRGEFFETTSIIMMRESDGTQHYLELHVAPAAKSSSVSRESSRSNRETGRNVVSAQVMPTWQTT